MAETYSVEGDAESSKFSGFSWAGSFSKRFEKGIPAIQGTYYFNLEKGGERISQQVTLRDNMTAIAGGATFRASALIRPTKSSGGRIEIEILDDRRRTIQTVVSETVTDQSWQTVNLDFDMPTSARHVVFHLVGSGSKNTLFDDARFQIVQPDYLSFGLTLDDVNHDLTNRQGYLDSLAVSVTGIDLWSSVSGDQSVPWELRSSHDDFASVLASGASEPGDLAAQRVSFNSPLMGLRSIDDPIEFRLYVLNDRDVEWTIDNLSLLGDVGSLADIPLPPVALADEFGSVGDPFFISRRITHENLLQNDFDPNGTPVQFLPPARAVDLPDTVTLRQGGGQIWLDAPDDFSGPVELEYTIYSDGDDVVGTAIINVAPLPIARDDSVVVIAGTTRQIPFSELLSNDSFEAYSQIPAVFSIQAGANLSGNLVQTQTGFEYTPPDGTLSGNESFTYTVAFANAAYSAKVNLTIGTTERDANDDQYSVKEGQTLEVNAASSVLRNDLPGLDGIPLVASDATGDYPAPFGTVNMNADGSFTYAPPHDDYYGTDRFYYYINPGGGGPVGQVKIQVTPVNDIPIAKSLSYTEYGTDLTIRPIDDIATRYADHRIDVETRNSNLTVSLAANTPKYVTLRSDERSFLFDSSVLDLQVGESVTFRYHIRDKGQPLNLNEQASFSETITVRRGEHVLQTSTDNDDDSNNSVSRSNGGFFGSHNGYLAGSKVYLDANANLVHDAVERIDPETGQRVSVMEPSATTLQDGSFDLVVPTIFDVDGDGFLSPADGTLVVEDGTVLNTGLPLDSQLRSPAGALVVSPLTTLLWQMVNEFNVTYGDAGAALRTSFDLPDVDLLQFHSLDATLAGQPIGGLVYRSAVALQNLWTAIGTSISNQSAVSKKDARQLAISEIARRALLGQEISLTDATLIREIYQSIGVRVGIDVSAPETVARVIADLNAAMSDPTTQFGENFLEAIARVERVAMETLAPRLAQLARGEITPGDVQAQLTGEALVDLVTSAAIGRVRPIRLAVDDAIVRYDDGISNATVQVTLSDASTEVVTVAYQTKDASGVAGVDYQPVAGMLEFQPGEVEATIEVPILFDTDHVTAASFLLELGDATGAVVVDFAALVLVIGGGDEDGVPTEIEQLAFGGDGNDDGAPDALQSHVASIPASDPEFVWTIEADSSAGIHSVTTGPSPVELSETILSSPLGQLGFIVPARNGIAEVSITGSFPLEGTAWYQPTQTTWQTFDWDGQSGAELTDIDGDGRLDEIRLRLIDGGRGDRDGLVNGEVQVVGALVDEGLQILVPLQADVSDSVSVDVRFAIGQPHPSEVTVDWGDGTSETLMIGDPGNPSVYTGAHQYQSPGEFEIEFRIVLGDTQRVATRKIEINRLFEIVGTSEPDLVRLIWDDDTGRARVKINDEVQTFETSDFGNVRIDTFEGADRIIVENDFPLSLIVNAGPGDDVVYGGGAADTLVGDIGRDLIFGRAGDDQIDGGPGNDLIYGNIGNDLILGGDDHDYINGGPDNDTLMGGSGRDILIGADGDDEIDGGAGRNFLYGSRDNDLLIGGDQSDYLFGGGGDDEIRGGGGNDVAFGNSGFDVLSGGPGDDFLSGDHGDDEILGGEGDDQLFGRNGNDLIRGGDGDDLVKGDFGDDQLFGEAGSDALIGNWGNDLLVGGPGQDFLSAAPGDDVEYQNEIGSGSSLAEGEQVGSVSPRTFAGFINRDTNRDGHITALDALLVINRLARNTSDRAFVTSVEQQQFDANGDDHVSALDALFIINQVAQENSPPSDSATIVDILEETATEISSHVVSRRSQTIAASVSDLAILLMSDEDEDREQVDQLVDELFNGL